MLTPHITFPGRSGADLLILAMICQVFEGGAGSRHVFPNPDHIMSWRRPLCGGDPEAGKGCRVLTPHMFPERSGAELLILAMNYKVFEGGAGYMHAAR